MCTYFFFVFEYLFHSHVAAKQRGISFALLGISKRITQIPFFVTYAEEGHHVLAVFLINHVGASWKIVVESIAYLFAGSVLLGLDISAICAWE